MFGWLGSWLGSWLQAWIGAGGQPPPDEYLVTAELVGRIRKRTFTGYITKVELTACCKPLQTIIGGIEVGLPTSCPTGAIASYAPGIELEGRIRKAAFVAYIRRVDLEAGLPQPQVAFGNIGTIIDACV